MHNELTVRNPHWTLYNLRLVIRKFCYYRGTRNIFVHAIPHNRLGKTSKTCSHAPSDEFTGMHGYAQHETVLSAKYWCGLEAATYESAHGTIHILQFNNKINDIKNYCSSREYQAWYSTYTVTHLLLKTCFKMLNTTLNELGGKGSLNNFRYLIWNGFNKLLNKFYTHARSGKHLNSEKLQVS